MPRVGRLFPAAVWTSALCLAQCSVQTVELKPGAPRPAGPLEVLSASAGAADPLPVAGTRLAFSQLADAAADSVAAACGPWAERHRRERPGGWQLQLELVRAQAQRRGDRLEVELESRVTLRARAGREHLGQTRGYCKADGPQGDPPAAAARCLERMAKDLAGWLEGVPP